MSEIKTLKEKINLLEKEIELLKLEVNESNSRLNESQKISKIGSWSWGIETNVVHWSEGMFNILGLKPHSETPNYELALKFVHPSDKDRYENTLKEALAKKKEYYLENRIVKKDGNVISVISRGNCFCNSKGELIKMIGTVQDVTVINQLFSSNIKLEKERPIDLNIRSRYL